MRGRPNLYTSYKSEQAMLPTWSKRFALLVLLAIAILLPAEFLPFFKWMGSDSWLEVLTRTMIYAIGALGLNLLTGYAGQVSFGHAFFVGIGAYTAAVLGGSPGSTTWGLELPIWIWLPAAGVVAGLTGVLIAPTAVRVRGLYLAFVTLGLVFIGEHLFRTLKSVTGGAEIGRKFPKLEVRLWKEEEPLWNFTKDGPVFGLELSGETKTYFLVLVILVIAVILTKNIARTRTGRAFQAIRDRDIAASIMGVAEARYKTIAFAISSAYAGIAGALLGAFVGLLIPESFNLFMATFFIAIVLIGGAGTVSGTLMGAFFVMTLPRLLNDFSDVLNDSIESGGWFSPIANTIVSTGPGDFGIISSAAVGPGLSIFQAQVVLYGLFIILFLIFEPLGLFGIWIKIRNYWKGWPFSY